MPTGKLITDTMRDNILLLAEKGISATKIAALLSCGRSTVSGTLSVYYAVKNNEPLPSYANGRAALVKWAYRVNGLPCPDTRELSEGEQTSGGKADNDAGNNTATNEQTATNDQLADAISALTAAVANIDKQLSTIQMTLAGFRADTGENVKKIVEAVNINGDIETKENDKIIDILQGIKYNTKKKGNYTNA